MAVKDARPSGFTQLATTLEWEQLVGSYGLFDGVNDVPGGTALQGSFDVPGRNIQMNPGMAVIKGEMWSCDSIQATAIPAASGLNRIDRLVLRLNRAAATSPTVIAPALIQGTPSSTPVEPSLNQTTSGFWDIPICSWTSASSGTLSGLKDERQFAGGSVLLGTAALMPTPAEPCLCLQTDTQSIMAWNGSAWVAASASGGGTSWANMGSMSASWTVGGLAKWRLTGDGLLVLAWRNLNPGTLTDGTTIWSAANGLPAAARPATLKVIGGVTDHMSNPSSLGTESCAVVLNTDGSVQVQGLAGASVTRLDVCGTYPIDV
jgi:hypothetical protein